MKPRANLYVIPSLLKEEKTSEYDAETIACITIWFVILGLVALFWGIVYQILF